MLATRGFEAAGYEVRRAEKAPYHPLFVIKLKCLTAPRFAGRRELEAHVREYSPPLACPCHGTQRWRVSTGIAYS